MHVINQFAYDTNPYNPLIYQDLGPRYLMTPGTIADAAALLAAEGRAILHLHWEEAFVRWQADDAAAMAAAEATLAELRAFKAGGGRIVWTIHNEQPHEGEYLDAFMRLRRGIAALADRVLVHNRAAIPLIVGQSGADPARIVLLPHPSYLGVYESEAETFARAPDWDSRRLLLFGMLRRYKGLEALIDAMAAAPEVEVDIVGEATSPDHVDAMMPRIAATPGLTLAPERVEDADVPARLRAHRGLVLPYSRFLTSGVAMLAMTFGRPIIAPDLPQLREILPAAQHPLLYPPGDTDALAERMRRLVATDRAELARLRDDLQARARQYSPAQVSERLAALLDRL